MYRLPMVLLMLGVAGTTIAAVTTTNVGKDLGTPYANPREVGGGLRQGLDTIPGLNIGQLLPYTDTGTTLGYINDYDEVCPYSGSTAGDVVYNYVADGAFASLSIDLCYSSYDTKIYVYDSTDLVTPIACNDDFYFAAPCYTYASYLGQVPVVSGHTYYIVIDGYGGSVGSYIMTITDGGIVPPSGACCAPSGSCTIRQETQCPGVWQGGDTVCVPNPCPVPPPIECPPGALIEDEPTCQDNYIDHYNGGCNSTPMIWQSLAPQGGGCAVVCGKSCTYLLNGGSTRDTDWFRSTSAGAPTLTMTANFPFMVGLCSVIECDDLINCYELGDAFTTVTMSVAIAVGSDVEFFASNQGFSGYPDEGTYVLSVCGIQGPPPPPGACCTATGACVVTAPEDCSVMGGTFQGDPTCTPTTCQPVPTEKKSWGAVKNLYRDATR